VRYPFDLLIQLRLDEKGAMAFSKGAVLNTDDNLLLELAAPRSLYHNRIDVIRSEISRHSRSIIDHLTGYTSEAEIYFELAASHFTAGNKEEAYRTCLHSLRITDSFNGRKLLGQILQSMSRNREAREAFIAALSLGGEDGDRKIVEALLQSLESADMQTP
jgi:tetratricopeptide (TPR) repeat protein